MTLALGLGQAHFAMGPTKGRHQKTRALQSAPETFTYLLHVVRPRSRVKSELGKLSSALEKQLMLRWCENGRASCVLKAH